MAVHGQSVVTHHPDTGRPVGGIQVPYWKKILLIAASAFDMTGLGYLGVDVVIDREQGPLLLELNARPGLGIQIANMVGHRSRLEHIDAAPPTIFNDTGRAYPGPCGNLGLKTANRLEFYALPRALRISLIWSI